jgi:hypothetical protein
MPTSNLIVNEAWEQAFWIAVPLALQSKSNFRRNPKLKTVWSKPKNFERNLGIMMLSARPNGWLVGDRNLPLASRPVVVSFMACKSNIDVANFSKSVLDACQGILYVGDASVLGETSIGSRGQGDSITLGFARLVPGSDESAKWKAIKALGDEIINSLYPTTDL